MKTTKYEDYSYWLQDYLGYFMVAAAFCVFAGLFYYGEMSIERCKREARPAIIEWSSMVYAGHSVTVLPPISDGFCTFDIVIDHTWNKRVRYDLQTKYVVYVQ